MFVKSKPRHQKLRPDQVPADTFVLPVAVGNRRRPVKVVVKLATDGTPSFVSPQIWKSASTTLMGLLADKGAIGPHFCPSGHSPEPCRRYVARNCSWAAAASWASWSAPRTVEPGRGALCTEDPVARRKRDASFLLCDEKQLVNPTRACLLHGSFACPDLSQSRQPRDIFRFAFVRDPLDRFLSTFRPRAVRTLPGGASKDPFLRYDPHGSWQHCHASECRAEVSDLKIIAANLERLMRVWVGGGASARCRTRASTPEFVMASSYRGMLTHALTQMYFLSGTDAAGSPLRLDFVGKLESFASDWAQVSARISGSGPAAVLQTRGEHRNRGGEHAALRAAVEREPAIVCPLCRIYAQDYECLGYAKPAACTSAGAGCRLS